jgi:hypothetical protein
MPQAATSAGAVVGKIVSGRIEHFQMFQAGDGQTFRITLACLASSADKTLERRAPCIILVDARVDQQIDAPGPFESEICRTPVRHELFSRQSKSTKEEWTALVPAGCRFFPNPTHRNHCLFFPLKLRDGFEEQANV